MRVPLTPRSSLFDIPHLTRREDFMRQVPLLPCRLCRDPATVTFADPTHNFHSKYFLNKNNLHYSKLQTIFIKQIELAPPTTYSFVEEEVNIHCVGFIFKGTVGCSSKHKGLHTQRARLGLLSVPKSIFHTIKWRRERQGETVKIKLF